MKFRIGGNVFDTTVRIGGIEVVHARPCNPTAMSMEFETQEPICDKVEIDFGLNGKLTFDLHQLGDGVIGIDKDQPDGKEAYMVIFDRFRVEVE